MPERFAGWDAASCSSHDPRPGRSDKTKTDDSSSDDARPPHWTLRSSETLDSGFVADHPMGATRLAIPLYLMKSSLSLHFLESLRQPNEKTHSSADVNRVVQRFAQLLEVIAFAEGSEVFEVERAFRADDLGLYGFTKDRDGSSQAAPRLVSAQPRCPARLRHTGSTERRH